MYRLAITACYSQVVALFFLTQSDTCKQVTNTAMGENCICSAPVYYEHNAINGICHMLSQIRT